MNEIKSLKLHKSHKILCTFVCFVIVLSVFTLSCFAISITPGDYMPRANPPLAFERVQFVEDAEVNGFAFDPDSGTMVAFSYLRMSYLAAFDVFSITAYDVDPTLTDATPVGLLVAVTPDTTAMYRFTLTGTNDIPSNLNSFLLANYELETYDGNPWLDILNGVVEALDVNIFGTFSYLDIVSTLAGACLAIWLLKMLAGG